MASTPPTGPDPRTVADEDDAIGEGVSAPAPAEGNDDTSPQQPGSPAG